MSEPLTLEKLLLVRSIAAQIVVRDGEKYLPIFERVDQEVEAMKARQTSLEKALMIAAETGGD